MTPAAPFNACPQCHTSLQSERHADGHVYRRCPRCGWNDHDMAGYVPPTAQEEAEYQAKAAARKKNVGCVWAVVLAAMIGILALILFLLQKG
jgi:anaerobic ribonucleoside-triphosphate reductase